MPSDCPGVGAASGRAPWTERSGYEAMQVRVGVPLVPELMKPKVVLAPAAREPL
jgi:hypothetical protein